MDRKPKIIVVYGPTGSGKSAMAVKLAHKKNGEIISADSRQIFRHLDIGTGKITKDEMEGVPHYFIDICDPREVYTVADFKRDAIRRIEEIASRGKIPIICGGTGLYIDSVVFDLDVENGSNDFAYREELERFRQKHGNQALWEMLYQVDPEYAKEIHPNSYPYVMRGLEVWKTTGKSKRDFRTERKLRFPTEFVTPYDGDRATLYDRINRRVANMFEIGLMDEIKSILDMGYTRNDPGLESIGYREAIDCLEGVITQDEAIARMQQLNRNYAKRQITWGKRYEGLRFPLKPL